MNSEGIVNDNAVQLPVSLSTSYVFLVCYCFFYIRIILKYSDIDYIIYNKVC